MKRTYTKYINNWSAISERLITIELELRGQGVVIVGIYAPNEDTTETGFTTYVHLTEFLRRLHSYRVQK